MPTDKTPTPYSPEELSKIIDDLCERSLQVKDPEIKAAYSNLASLAATLQLQMAALQNRLETLETLPVISFAINKRNS